VYQIKKLFEEEGNQKEYQKAPIRSFFCSCGDIRFLEHTDTGDNSHKYTIYEFFTIRQTEPLHELFRRNNELETLCCMMTHELEHV
jgi:hypothetical protein